MGDWVESGRVTSIVVGPGGSRVYAGAANGGVWYSPDAGASWSPLDDYAVSPSVFGSAYDADSLAVGAIAVRFGGTAAADEIFVGAGGAIGAYFSIGIRHLAGGTWSLEATNLTNAEIHALAIDPDDVTKVYAATSLGLFRRPATGVTNWENAKVCTAGTQNDGATPPP